MWKDLAAFVLFFLYNNNNNLANKRLGQSHGIVLEWYTVGTSHGKWMKPIQCTKFKSLSLHRLLRLVIYPKHRKGLLPRLEQPNPINSKIIWSNNWGGREGSTAAKRGFRIARHKLKSSNEYAFRELKKKKSRKKEFKRKQENFTLTLFVFIFFFLLIFHFHFFFCEHRLSLDTFTSSSSFTTATATILNAKQAENNQFLI